MARLGLLHVPGHECRPPESGGALRFHVQSQFRRAPGAGRAHSSGQPRHGRGNGRCRPFRRLSGRRKFMMQAFTTLKAVVAPLERANVDTDAIIPKQYLKSIKRTGFGPYLFDEWRYLDPGDLDVDLSTRRKNPDFVL